LKDTNDFSQGSVSGAILRMAGPITLAQLVSILYNIVDRMYLGHLQGAGAMALTGLGLCLPVISVVMAFARLSGMGGGPLCSIERGRGDLEEAERIMGNSFTLLLIFAVVLTLLGEIFLQPILYAFGASDATIDYGMSYGRIYLAGNLFVLISLGMNSFINAQGFARIGMGTTLIGAIANLLLDPLFIFAFGWGVRGAALATILSQALSALWVMKFLTGSKAQLRLKPSCMVLEKKRVGRILSLGFSGFVMALTNSLVQICCNSVLSSYGGDLYVGVMTVISSIREVVSMPVQGISGGAEPVMGFNYGANKPERVRQGIRFISLCTLVYAVLVWLLIRLVPGPIIRIFNSEPELLEVAIPALGIYFSTFFMMALQFAGQSTFVSLGKSRQAVFFSVFRKVIIVVPLTLLLPRLSYFGVSGVFWAEAISNVVGGVACFGAMYLTVYRKLRMAH
jgi:putative MATE family efflux protein